MYSVAQIVLTMWGFMAIPVNLKVALSNAQVICCDVSGVPNEPRKTNCWPAPAFSAPIPSPFWHEITIGRHWAIHSCSKSTKSSGNLCSIRCTFPFTCDIFNSVDWNLTYHFPSFLYRFRPCSGISGFHNISLKFLCRSGSLMLSRIRTDCKTRYAYLEYLLKPFFLSRLSLVHVEVGSSDSRRALRGYIESPTLSRFRRLIQRLDLSATGSVTPKSLSILS